MTVPGGLFIVLTCGILTVSGLSDQIPPICAKKSCTEENGVFAYETGKTYRYLYQTNVSSDGVRSGEEALHGVDLIADLSVMSPCNYKLTTTLRSVKDNGVIPTESVVQNLRNVLEANDLYFGFYNGQIGEVCSADSEYATALSIKKGILSTLQISATQDAGFSSGTFVEVDLAGECPTVYTISNSSDGHYVIQKTRDTSLCSQSLPRTHLTAYFGSDLKTPPLTVSRPNCEHVVRNGIVHSTLCVESHALRPFRGYAASFSMRVTQKLTFQGTVTNPQPKEQGELVEGELRFSLLDTSALPKQAVPQLLDSLCNSVSDDIRPDTPTAFTDVVQALRMEKNCSNLMEIYRSVVSGSVCSRLAPNQRQRLLFDAIPAAGTSCAVELMANILREKDYDVDDKDTWFASLSYIKRPEKEMLDTLQPLLRDAKLPRSGYLGISALLQNYCRYHSGCDRKLIESVENDISRRIDKTCNTVAETEQDEQVARLLALGNLNVSRNTLDTLTRIVRCGKKPSSVRVAALQALRNRNCNRNSQIETELSRISSDVTEDVEVRIASVQRLMECPTESVIKAITGLYEDSTVNKQIKSYIYSYISDIQSSTEPSQQKFRQLLTGTELNPPEASNWLQSSKHFQKAFVSAHINGSIDGSIVFADSYLPRAADLGVNIELFGRKLDVFRIGGRQEGLETGIASLLAGRGPNDNKVDFSTYVRLFGNDIALLTSRDVEETIGNLATFDFIMGLTKEQSFGFARHMMLLDAAYTIPTASGLPVNLKVTASAHAQLKGRGALNIGGVLSTEPGMSIRGDIHPSAAVQVTAEVTIATTGIPTGFKTVSTLHSSTSLSGSVSYLRGQYFRTNIDLPKNKVEFINFETKSYGIQGDDQRLIVESSVPSVRSSLSECTAPLTSRMLGMELCMELESNDPKNTSIPRNGLMPANFRAFLRKTDKTMRGYKFVMEYPQPRGGEGPVYGFNVLFDTPGSKINRQFQLGYTFHSLSGILSGAAVSPWKKFVLEGQYRPTPIGLNVTVVEDDTRRHTLAFELATRMMDDYASVNYQSPAVVPVMNYKPSLRLKSPTIGSVDVSGDVNMKMDYSAVVVDLSFTSGVVRARTRGNYEGGQGHNVTATVSYQFGPGTPYQEFALVHQFKPLPMKSGLWRVAAVTSLESTQFPALNTKVEVDVLRSPNGWKQLETATIIRRRNFNDDNGKITVLAAYHMTQNSSSNKLTVNAGISGVLIPENRIQYVQQWDSGFGKFDGALTLLCSKTTNTGRLMWSNDWRVNKRLQMEFSLASPVHSLTIQGGLSDDSIPLSRQYPFHFSAKSTIFRPIAITGAASMTPTDAGIQLDIQRDTRSLLTSTHVVSWNPYSVTSDFNLLNHTGQLRVQLVGLLNWALAASYHRGDEAWKTEISFRPTESNITNAMGITATAIVERLSAGANRIRYGGEAGYFPYPRAPLKFFVFMRGYAGEKSGEVFYQHLTQLTRNFQHTSDLKVTTDFFSEIPKKTIFYVDVQHGTHATAATLMAEYTNLRLNRIELVMHHNITAANTHTNTVRLINTRNDQATTSLFSKWTVRYAADLPRILQVTTEGFINGTLIRIGRSADTIAVQSQFDFDGVTRQITGKLRSTWNTRNPTQQIDVHYHGNYSYGDVELSSNLSITTPFDRFRQAQLHGIVLRDRDGTRSMLANVMVNDVSVIRVEGKAYTPSNDVMARYPELKSVLKLKSVATHAANFTIKFPSSGMGDIEWMVKRSVDRVDNALEYSVDVGKVLDIENPMGWTYRKAPKNIDLELRFLERSLYGRLFRGGPEKQGFEILWDASRDLSKKFGIIRETSWPERFHETVSFEHPLFPYPHRKSIGLKTIKQPQNWELMFLVDDQVIMNVMPVLDLKNRSVTAKVFLPQDQPAPYTVLATMLDDNHVNVSFVDPETKALLLYRMALENHQILVQEAGWNRTFTNRVKGLVSLKVMEVWDTLRSLYQYSKTELKDVGKTFTDNKAYIPVLNALSSLASSAGNMLERQRRNYGFPPSQCSGSQADSGQQPPQQGCGGGSSAPSACGSSSSASQGCSSSSAFADSFASFANQVNSQFQQMMQDMMSKLQQQSSRGHQSFSSSVNVVSGGCGAPAQPQCAPAPVASPSVQRIQITIPSSGASPSQSQQQSYRQQSFSGYAASGSASYSSGYGSPSPPSYSPSYGSQPQPQAQASQQVPSYAQPPQGAQMHASQKSQYGSGSTHNQGASYSHTIPMGDTRLTIQIYQQPAAPSPSTYSGSGQYQAAASNNQEQSLSGQAQYGGRAEPRLQYCTPGSSEKGVCFHGGADSLEPTRSKRSLPTADATIQDYVLFCVGTVQDYAGELWGVFLAQPEVQYFADVSERMSRYITPRLVSGMQKATLDVKKQLITSFRNRVTAPLVNWDLNEDFSVLGVTQKLPVPINSLKKPLPKVLTKLGVLPSWIR
ncbi:uncharacterized protein LOC129583764 isoform X2 [Paramacrobiotus metropolitanus]|uniref:uncharacterized protein LOC129583764 isoform X2 n=1 Tax=Paramacrobiotus metropolitanus TaxID=2943436 RepID=UPI0024457AA0|nr:uncharacterized protein LOC129583764 isoform X2 [Paramacrobiotus metropolitanus]